MSVFEVKINQPTTEARRVALKRKGRIATGCTLCKWIEWATSWDHSEQLFYYHNKLNHNKET